MSFEAMEPTGASQQERGLSLRGRSTLSHRTSEASAVVTIASEAGEVALFDPHRRRDLNERAASLLPFASPSNTAFAVSGSPFSAVGRDAAGAVSWAMRDPFGIAPLCWTRDEDGSPVFSTHRAPLFGLGPHVFDAPPGQVFANGSWSPYYSIPSRPEALDVRQVRKLLALGVERQIGCWPGGRIGLLLSGGIDSCALAATLVTRGIDFVAITVGMEGSTDVEAAKELARLLRFPIEVRTFTAAEVLAAVPAAISAIESFNHSLVRNSIPTRFALEVAAELECTGVVTGDASDSLFAGQPYLVDEHDNRDALYRREFSDLYRTELRRIQNQAACVGIAAVQPYLDRELVEYVYNLPLSDKLRQVGDNAVVFKAALRDAFCGILPDEFCMRPKTSIDAGAAMALTTRHFAESVTDTEFEAKSGAYAPIRFISKEHLAYFDIWRDTFFQGGDDYSNYRAFGAYGSWSFYFE